MKIVQSFWSKPFQQPHNTSFESRMMGGFPLKRYFIYTWALSLLQLKRHFKQVHLITDDWGKRFFIDILQLPYDGFSTELNALEALPSKFWCAGKLHTFSTLKEPFLHFDGDLILGDRFDKDKVQQPLVAEFKYTDVNNIYHNALNELINKDKLFDLPTYLTKGSLSKHLVYSDYNMGIIGGYNYSVMNAYAISSINMIHNNLQFIPSTSVPVSFINCFMEQYCFYETCSEQQLKVKLCIEEPIASNTDYQKDALHNLNMDFDFVHLHNNYKLNYYMQPEIWLQRFYPSEHKRINTILFN